MASTNKTTHYNLSQYVGTDKPTYLVDYNTDMTNIDQGIYDAQSKANNNETNIGSLSELETTDKTTLVNAINENKEKTDGIGNLSNLTTENQNSLVSAINEVDSHADANNQNIGTMTNLETTVKSSLVGAINEVNTKINNTNEKLTNNNTYSTEEIDTGIIWINNKKVYRKVVSVNNIELSNSTTISHGIINLENVIPTSCGTYIDGQNNITHEFPLVTNNGTILNFDVSRQNIVFNGNETYSPSGARVFQFVIEYTKTTD